MDLNTGRLTPLERRLKRWPFWKKILLVLSGFALLGLTVGIIEGVEDGVEWVLKLWRAL